MNNMEINNFESKAYNAIDQQIGHLNQLVNSIQDFLQDRRPAVIPPQIYSGVLQLSKSLSVIHLEASNLEDERRSFHALAQVGQFINSSLEIDDVLQHVMDTIIKLTGAERGFLMLRSDDGEQKIRIARNWEQESLEPHEFGVSNTVIHRVVEEGQPVLTTNAQEDPRFSGQNSIVMHNLRSILCVPLIVKDEVTGVIYADNRIRSGLFTQKELFILSAFANQAAVALENARLFESVRITLAEVTELKNLMDNVFESIASGVLTADVQDRIMLCNRSARRILGKSSTDLVGKELTAVMTSLSESLEILLKQVIEMDEQVVGLETNPDIPGRGKVDLLFNISPLKDVEQSIQGVAIVVEDLTEKRQLEAQRRLFEKMVSPAVINQLNPDQIRLGGQKAEISILFADLRGFTKFSETVPPEELISVLNTFLAAAADAVLNEQGTVDKFIGDAVMAWFNAPIPQPDHLLRAVRSALAIQQAVDECRLIIPTGKDLSFGVGIHVGEAVLGLVGSEKRLEYTAIGDSVNTAKRIQENSAPGQILVSSDVYKQIADQLIVKEHGEINAKGKRDPLQVFEVIGIRE